MNNNIHNAESVKLLNGSLSSSESEGDVQFTMVQPVTSNTRRKVRTKRRSRSTHTVSKSDGTSDHLCSIFSVVKVAGVTVCIGGTIILTWLVLMLQSEVQLLNNRIASASYSSTNVTNLIFKNKHTIEQLLVNQSLAWSSVTNFTEHFWVITNQVTTLRNDIKEIKDNWKEVVQSGQFGKELEELKSNLAVFGAEFSSFKAEFEKSGGPTLHNTFEEFNRTLSSKIQWAVDDLRHHHELITSLQEEMKNVTIDMSSAWNASSQIKEVLSQRVDTLQMTLASLEAHRRNSTLTIQYILNVLQDLTKDHKNLTTLDHNE